MRNITFSADERLIEEARQVAQQKKTTLNEEFRRWLDDYVGRRERAARAMLTLHELQKTIKLNPPYTRDEMNER
jgi:hypothetical protein